MVEKVRTAVFKPDLRVEIKKYPLSKSGNKIDIVSSGEGYFMPEIGPDKFLDMPTRKKYLFFGPWVYERTFFALKQGAKCVDFLQGVVYGPDQEQLKKANLNLLASEIGSDRDKGTPWYIFVILGINLLMLIQIMQMSGVFN